MLVRAFFLALLGLAVSPAAAEETIERFASDVTVMRDGTLHVVETIRVHAERSQIKHGIYRDFPLTFEDASARSTRSASGFSASPATGARSRISPRARASSIRIYAGDKDVFLDPGTYTYVFTYETDRQIRWFDTGAELYWNVTGNAWAFPIESAVARVTLPDGAAPVDWTAYTGPYGARGTDWRGAVTDGVLAVETTRKLAPREGLTIVVALPAGAVAEPSGAAKARYFLRDYRGWIIGILGFAAVLGYYVAAWNAVGRDPKAGTIIPLFHAPEGVSPALAGYIHNWGFGMDARREFTAAALSLAVRGLVLFDQESKGELTLERTEAAVPGGVETLPPGERAILHWVERNGGEGRIAQDNAVSVASVMSKFRKGIESENKTKFFRRNTLYFVGGLALTVIVFLAIFVFGGLYGRELELLFPVLFTGGIFGFIVIPIVRTILAGPSLGAIVKAAMSLVIAIAFLGSFGVNFLTSTSGEPYGVLHAVTSFINAHPLPIALVLLFPGVERALPLPPARADDARPAGDGQARRLPHVSGDGGIGAAQYRRRAGDHGGAVRGAAALCGGARRGEAVGERLRRGARPRPSRRRGPDGSTTARAGAAAESGRAATSAAPSPRPCPRRPARSPPRCRAPRRARRGFPAAAALAAAAAAAAAAAGSRYARPRSSRLQSPGSFDMASPARW